MKNFTVQLQRCIVGFITTIVLALLLLWVSAYLPQSAIEYHVRASIDIIEEEGNRGLGGDYEVSSTLDGHTDALILHAALALHKDQIDAILTNPMYGTWENAADSLEELMEQETIDYKNVTWHYNRYWMGFRAPIRLLLSKLDYGQIRTYLGYGLFTLMTIAASIVARNTNFHMMFAFVLSIIFVKPQVICNSLQFSCCFFLALIAMLLVPYIQKNKRWEVLFFMELGMITMYFDFYTSPSIVCGYPLVFLLLLDIKENREIKVIRILRNIVIWLCGYVMMWIAKLTLTTVMTDLDAFGAAFRSFASRIGITKSAGMEEYYSVSLSLRRVYETILPNPEDKKIALIVATGGIVILIISLMKKKISLNAVKKCIPLLIIATLPIIWFAVSAQPTVIHTFFQYRNIALTYWAVGAFVCGIYHKAVA